MIPKIKYDFAELPLHGWQVLDRSGKTHGGYPDLFLGDMILEDWRWGHLTHVWILQIEGFEYKLGDHPRMVISSKAIRHVRKIAALACPNVKIDYKQDTSFMT